MSDRHEAALAQADYFQKLLPPGIRKDALGLAIKSGQLGAVKDALIGAKRDLFGLGMMVDHWVEAVATEFAELSLQSP